MLVSEFGQPVDFWPFSERFSSHVVLFNGNGNNALVVEKYTSVYFCGRQTSVGGSSKKNF